MNASLFSSKAYTYLKYFVLVINSLFVIIYMMRDSLYAINNKYITIFAGTVPNLVPGFLFTLIGIFYVVPLVFRTTQAIYRTRYLWMINTINILAFVLIEYLHVFFQLGIWDNLDIIATLIGIALATLIYFNFRKYFVNWKPSLC